MQSLVAWWLLTALLALWATGAATGSSCSTSMGSIGGFRAFWRIHSVGRMRGLRTARVQARGRREGRPRVSQRLFGGFLSPRQRDLQTAVGGL
jgi:hypothetical protein